MSWDGSLPLPMDATISMAMQSSFKLCDDRSKNTVNGAIEDSAFIRTATLLQHQRTTAMYDAQAVQMLSGQNLAQANAITSLRAGRDQPQVGPTLAFVPAPNPNAPAAATAAVKTA